MAGLEDDMRPRMFAARDRGEAFALITIVAAEGGGPRGLGSQMVVTRQEAAGFLSGGCIEADVILHGREVLADGVARHLVYGRGSPFVDTRLPCGGRLDLLVERITPDDAVLAQLARMSSARQAGWYRSDGVTRRTGLMEAAVPQGARVYLPTRQLVVIGWDPFALAIAAQGLNQSWDVVLLRPKGPDAPPPIPVNYRNEDLEEALAEIRLDAWTAVAIATHDDDLDHAALVLALGSQAGYVGVLGARRRLPERLERLKVAGLSEATTACLQAPIGLAIGARTPAEVGVSVIAQIIAQMSVQDEGGHRHGE